MMLSEVSMYSCCGDLYLVFVFFFKQKTAYEMRISDWSSDVCSSDLQENQQDRRLLVVQPFEQRDDDSHAQENEREDVSRVEATLEPPSQNQQSCSRQTPHKVGSLDERQRQAMAEP